MSFKGLMIGVTGLNAQSKKMEVIGNNLANISTTGFKSGNVSFNELFNDTLKSASAGEGNLGGTNPMTIGNGVGVASINNNFTQGAQIATGRTLDFMIEGNDFFAVKNGGDGNLMLSRNGAFQIDDNMNLVDSLGNKVQGFTVNRETGAVSSTAGNISLQTGAINPHATGQISLQNNIDSSVSESVADSDTLAWELFSGGENFGKLTQATLGGSGSKTLYGSGFYQDNILYHDASATLNAALDTVTLNASPANMINGFHVGDTVNLLQNGVQVQRTINAVDTGTGAITLSSAVPGTFATGTIDITDITNASDAQGSSGGNIDNDILRSQIAVVDENGNLLASFYRVSGTPQQYSRATASLVGGGNITIGSGEFTNVSQLRDLMERTLRDTQLTHYAASDNLNISLDKFGKMSFEGTGLVQNFRLVMNADNTEMLDRFQGIAITDDGAVATTQARIDENGKILDAPALALGNRSVNASKWWYNAAGLENYGYSGTSPSTEYGEFAGLRFDGGASGSGYGIIQLSTVNALGDTVSTEFTMVPRDADPNQNQFSTLGELAQLLQNTLRTAQFSSLAEDGTLVADTSASVSCANGRLSLSTSDGVFHNLKIAPVNITADGADGIERTDYTNFGTVLGQLATGVNGKSASSNEFIAADARVETKVYDSQGNEHNVETYLVRDRSSGLNNVEWKFKTSLNPNLNTFATDSDAQSIYANTYNSIEDSHESRGVLAFDITSGAVLGAAAGNDARYVDVANIAFHPTTTSQEADVSRIDIDFSSLTSYNGQNTVVGNNVDGFAMGNLVRIVTEDNTGNINGVYSNGKIRTLAKIGLMSIANPEGLQKIGSSYYMQTPNSSSGGQTKGVDQIFSVGAQSPESSDSVSSKIHGGALEGSNVDLTQELTDMISTQRSFSASGKIITTSDEMLQEALNLKR